MQALLEHPWPGNVRELEHAVERAVLMARGAAASSRATSACARRGDGARRALEEMTLEEVESAPDPAALRAPRRQREPGRRRARACRAARCTGGSQQLRALRRRSRELARRAPTRRRARTMPRARSRRARRRRCRAWRSCCCGRGDSRREAALDAHASLVVGAGSASRSALRERVVRPLQTLVEPARGAARGRLLDARRAAPRATTRSALALLEVNALGETLREQRLGALEATALLRTVMAEIDVAVFAFDDGRRAAAGEPRRRAAARPAAPSGCSGATRPTLGLARAARRRDAAHARARASRRRAGAGRCAAARSARTGVPHRAAGAHRPEPRAARGGAPGLAAAGARARPRDQQLARADPVDRRQPARRCSTATPRPTTASDDLRARARGHRARAPRRSAASWRRTRGWRGCRRRRSAPVDVGAWVRRVAALETRAAGARSTAGPDGHDRTPTRDQLEQLLINLVRNAVDAALETGGGVAVGWARRRTARSRSRVEDDGPGLADTANLFVPFFTTKPSGIGHRPGALPPDRRGARRRAHARESRADAGSVATVWLPSGIRNEIRRSVVSSRS